MLYLTFRRALETEGADLSCENNDLLERLPEFEKELENLREKVEELEKKNEAIVAVINMTNQMYMRLFEKAISLLEQLPESIAKVAVEQLKKDLMETAKKLDKVRKNFYVA